MTATVDGQGIRLPAVDTSEQALARLTATLAATAGHYDRIAGFPWEPVRAVHKAGLLTLGVAPEYGGARLAIPELARVLQALGQGDPSVALLTAMTILQHLQQARLRKWPDALYRQAVADSVKRPVLLNAVRSEPELGTPTRGGVPATKATRTANGWLINGRKSYATGAEGLDYHLVWAATADDEPLLAHAIVPGDSPGIEVIRTWDHLGLRASSTHDVVYTNVEVPAENFRGLPAAQAAAEAAGFGTAGITVIALYVGVARAAQEFFLAFANERVPTALGRPIATTERIQTIAGEIEAQLIQAEEVLYGLAARLEAGDEDAVRRAGVAKLLITRSIITAVQTALAAIGNPGLTRHNPLERHFRDIQCCRIHPPQDDIALLTAGRRTLGALRPGDQTQRQRNPSGHLPHHGSVWSTMEDRHYHEHATRTHVGRPPEEEAMGAIHDWATPENLQPEPITVEIWRELPEEFCRQVEVVNGQAVRCEAPRRTHQTAARRLATMLDSAAADYVALHPGPCLDVSNDFDVILWEVPTATIRRPDLALHNCAPDDVRPLPASYIRVIIEVVSPGSDKTDRVEKMGEYASAGIPFYWLVWISDNRVASIDVYVLDHAIGAYRLLRTLGPEDELSVLEVPVRIKVPWSELSALVR